MFVTYSHFLLSNLKISLPEFIVVTISIFYCSNFVDSAGFEKCLVPPVFVTLRFCLSRICRNWQGTRHDRTRSFSCPEFVRRSVPVPEIILQEYSANGHQQHRPQTVYSQIKVKQVQISNQHQSAKKYQQSAPSF